MLVLRHFPWILLLFCVAYVGGAQVTLQATGSSDASVTTNGKKKILTREFTEYAHHLMELWNVKGAAIAVVKPSGEVEFDAWGNKTEDGERMTPDTLFGIASCSKAFLSTSLGILFDDYSVGKNNTPLPDTLSIIDWNSKIKDVLPGEWALQDKWASEKANVRDILSHMSGMPRHDASYSPSDSTADIVRRMKFLRPAYELRQKFSYNNQMYMIGAHIVSKYTGSYTEFATERIFKTLGMNSTTFSPLEAKQSGKQTQSWTMHGQRIPHWMPEDVKELNAGPGGIITSVIDLSKWLKMLLNSGVNPTTNVTVVPKSVFKAVTTSGVIQQGEAVEPEFSIKGYGMGWDRFSYQGHEVISHSGAIPGLTSHVSFYPNDDFGIAVILNTGDRNRVALALHYRVAEEVLGLPHVFSAEEPPSSPPSHPHPPHNSTTPIPLSAYAGTYSNPGYGSATLCDPTGSSHYCDEVLSAFRAVDDAQSAPLPPATDVPQLFGAWPRLWSSHVRFVHAENSTFNVALTALFPEGYGASKRPFETFELDLYEGQAEFIVNEEKGTVEGFGIYDIESMGGTKRNGASVKEEAMAWFDKV